VDCVNYRPRADEADDRGRKSEDRCSRNRVLCKPLHFDSVSECIAPGTESCFPNKRANHIVIIIATPEIMAEALGGARVLDVVDVVLCFEGLSEPALPGDGYGGRLDQGALVESHGMVRVGRAFADHFLALSEVL